MYIPDRRKTKRKTPGRLLIATIGTGISSLFNLATSGPARWFLSTSPGAGQAATQAANDANQAVTTATTQGSLIWTGFLTLLITLAAAAIFGGLGGATSRHTEHASGDKVGQMRRAA